MDEIEPRKAVSQDSRVSVPSTLQSPMVKMIAQEMRSTNADAELSPSALASQRLRTPSKSSLLSRDMGSDSQRNASPTVRGLRTSTNAAVDLSKSVGNGVSTGSMNAELRAVVRRQVVKAIETSVPVQVSKSVAKLPEQQLQLFRFQSVLQQT